MMAIPIRAGREVEERDLAGAPDVAVINEAAARAFWPGESPLGRQIVLRNFGGGRDAVPTQFEIVGVVSDMKNQGIQEAVVRQYVRRVASPRGLQALVAGAQVRALLDDRFNVSREDLQDVALPALRHRLILGFEAQADGVTQDRVVTDVLAAVPFPRP